MLLPDLSQLSHEQKDELIRQQAQQIQELVVQVSALQAQLVELQRRLSKSSRNSSKPPSSDGLNKPQPKSLRESGALPSGGQKGHEGKTLKRVSTPDKVVIHEAPERCDACQSRLSEPEVVEARQVFDLPELKFEVTEHRVLQAQCSCGKAHRGRFPQAVRASVQYGPKALAAMVHLNQNHMVPLKRTASLMGELFGLPVSQGTVVNASVEAAQRLKPTVQAIGQALVNAPVVHADETGLRVAGSLHWMHVLATNELTWVGCHAKRGGAAFEALGLLGQFNGTLIHDGWKPYRGLECEHGLCNAHHLRELTYVLEELGQGWAGDMIELLKHANHLDNTAQLAAPGTTVDEQEVQQLRDLYEAILDDGDACNPRQSASGKPGRTKQSKPANLLSRLRQYADDVWRFIIEPDVPFTNNVAEQAVRMPKVKQKVSGCFRTLEGANAFCIIRSYLATMHKQRANLFDSLAQTFLGCTPVPRLA